MEEDGEDQTPRSPPFWMQTTTNLTRIQRYRRRLSSLFFNSFVLIIFLLLFAIISMLYIIPSLIHSSSNIFKPNIVKRSWDSINLLLVLVALLFGFLSRNITSNNDDEKTNAYDQVDTRGAPIMYDLQDQSMMMDAVIGLRRQRTSVSYPDLRELSPDPWRFSDDTHLSYYRSNRTHRLDYKHGEGLYFPPPQPPPNANTNIVKQKMKRERSHGFLTDKILSPERESWEQQNGGTGERKRGNAAEKRRARSSEPRKLLTLSPEGTRNDGNATQDFFTSFSHKKKKKRQRDKSADNLGALMHHSQPPQPVIFKPPTPPPPPPLQRAVSYAPRVTIKRVAPFVTDKPIGTALMMTSINGGIDESSSGGESPMKQIPPPPPLPPFKMPDWKFAVEGDFVRLQSTLSSRSASPEGDEAQSPSSDIDITTATTLFSPSPDVDTKADSFIARFRAGLKLERMSKLGPGTTDN